MQKVKNSCGKRRGCKIDYVLPTDRRFKPIHSRMLRKPNDIKKVLFKARFLLDKVA